MNNAEIQDLTPTEVPLVRLPDFYRRAGHALQVVDAASRAAVASLDSGRVPADALVFASDAGMVVAIVGRDLRAWSVAAVK